MYCEGRSPALMLIKLSKITEPKLVEEMEKHLSKCTVLQLKSLARQFKVPVSAVGRKVNMVQKLIDFGKSGKLSVRRCMCRE